MMKSTAFIFCLLFGGTLFSQRSQDSISLRPLNSISLNIAGDGSLGSLNYERMFLTKSSAFISGRIGAGYNREISICLFKCETPKAYLTVPLTITGNIGKEKHFFEFGIGVTGIVGDIENHFVVFPIVGYRLQPLISKKINFRIFAEYPLFQEHEREFLLWEDVFFIPIGVSFGICF